VCRGHIGAGLRVKPIFISYSSQHRDVTESLARRLEGAPVALPDVSTEHLTVWWDCNLRAGSPFTPDITRALDEAPSPTPRLSTPALPGPMAMPTSAGRF